jgi:hypothetical protein
VAAHARVGPSSLTRVILCRGSVRATDGLPNPDSEASAEGTVLHDIAADCMENGLDAEDFVGQTYKQGGFEFTIGYEDDEVDPRCMNDAMDWARQQPGLRFVEQRVELDPWMPDQFGTLDLGWLYEDLLTVFDWKFGRGVLVRVMTNDQLRAYALGLLRLIRALGHPDPTRIRIIIEQPRCPGGARYFEPWEITLAELLEWGEFIKGVMFEIDDPDAPRHAGEKPCRFCTAQNKPEGCPEHTAFELDLVGLKFSNLDEDDEPSLPDYDLLTPARRSYIVRHRSMFTAWLERLHASALEDALIGNPTPGLKAVDGQRGNRTYTDAAAVEAFLIPILGDKTFNQKLITPPKVEAIMMPGKKKPGHPAAWAELQDFITQSDGKPILVSEDDPRPAKQAAVDRFEDLDAPELSTT